MTLLGFKAQNHRQQVGKRGARARVDDRETDPALFAQWDARFHFTIDVAAAAHNAKCERFYTVDDDGLSRSWAGERVWCNPPYSDIRPWVQMAWHEHYYMGAELVVMLLPANRTEQSWWQDLVEPFRDGRTGNLRVEFLRGRLRFIQAGRQRIGANERPPFGCCLLIWGDDDRQLERPLPTGEPRQLSLTPEVR